jgi:hypothetical protein
VQNHSCYLNGRQYSRETLLWTRHVYEISPQGWKAVRKALPLPGKRLPLSEFLDTGPISKALLEIGEIGPLLELWKHVIPEGLEDRRIILSVDAVAFQPLITLPEDGTIDGLMTFRRLENPDLFSQFVANHSISEEALERRTHFSVCLPASTCESKSPLPDSVYNPRSTWKSNSSSHRETFPIERHSPS